MCKYWITFYDVNREHMFRLKTENCSQDWAIDEAEDMLKMCPEAKTYTINLAI